MSKYLLNVLVVLSFGATELYGQQLYPREAKDWGVLNKIIYSAYSSSKLTVKAQETQNGVLFLFEPTKDGKRLVLLTHIIFNERNSSEYSKIVRNIATKVANAVDQLEDWNGKDKRTIIVPLAIIDSGMSYSTTTVFNLNPELRQLMQFFTERKEYDLRPILRVQQYSVLWLD